MCMCIFSVILFISNGQPTIEDYKDDFLDVISEENAKLNNQVVIHTFGIGKGARK